MNVLFLTRYTLCVLQNKSDNAMHDLDRRDRRSELQRTGSGNKTPVGKTVSNSSAPGALGGIREGYLWGLSLRITIGFIAIHVDYECGLHYGKVCEAYQCSSLKADGLMAS